jgi:hypothetical protein
MLVMYGSGGRLSNFLGGMSNRSFVLGTTSEPDSDCYTASTHVNPSPLCFDPFGAHPPTPPSIREVEWTVNEGGAWAVVSSLRGEIGRGAFPGLLSSFPFELKLTNQTN